MLQLKLLVADRIHAQRNKFAKVLENKATCDSKSNYSLVQYQLVNKYFAIIISGCIA